MDNKTFLKLLRKIGACVDIPGHGIAFVGDMDFAAAYAECKRADDALWFMERMELGTKRERIHLVCACAETAKAFWGEHADVCEVALKAARAYADDPSDENRVAAHAAANAAASAASAAANAAANAAYAAANAARAYADDPSDENRVAASAVIADADAVIADADAVIADASAAAAAYAADAASNAADAARNEAHLKMCAMIRQQFPLERVLKLLEASDD